MQPFSPHSRFFSSLKQVEDRLASENRTNSKRKCSPIKPALPSEAEEEDQQLSSPIFLDYPRLCAEKTNQKPPHHQDSSEPPSEFLSCSLLPQGEEEEKGSPKLQSQKAGSEDVGEAAADDIEQLLSLLGLSASEEGEGGSSCDCSGGGFYSNVAGLKGPKCNKERQRLERWIQYYYATEKEPARMAHLLLAKAVSAGLNGGDDSEHGFGGTEYPVTVEEFLKYDPPEDEV